MEFSQNIYPFWLYAHIIRGPFVKPSVDAQEFLSKAKKFDNSLAVLSPGWEYSSLPFVSYSKAQIWEMIDAIRFEKITQNLSFGVNANIASHSVGNLMILKEEVPNCTLTIWSRQSMFFTKKLKKLISDFGKDRVYIDVPENLKKRLIS